MKLMVVVLSKKDYKKWYASVSDKKLETNKTFKNVYPVGKPVAAPVNDSIPAGGAMVDSLPKMPN
jgi:heme/copper-type cytochrome/quinol oxidase subunit 2